MADLTVQTIVEAGLQATYPAAAAGGDTAAKNGSGGSLTVQVTAQNTSTSQPGWGTVTKGNVSVAVGAGEERFIGPFPISAFNNSSNKIAITYPGGVTSLTIAALKLPKAA